MAEMISERKYFRKGAQLIQVSSSDFLFGAVQTWEQFVYVFIFHG